MAINPNSIASPIAPGYLYQGQFYPVDPSSVQLGYWYNNTFCGREWLEAGYDFSQIPNAYPCSYSQTGYQQLPYGSIPGYNYLQTFYKTYQEAAAYQQQLYQQYQYQMYISSTLPAQNVPRPVEVQRYPLAQNVPRPVEVQRYPLAQDVPRPVEVQRNPLAQNVPRPVEVQRYPLAQNVPRPVEVQRYPLAQDVPRPVEVQRNPLAQNVPRPVEVQRNPLAQNVPRPVEVQRNPFLTYPGPHAPSNPSIFTTIQSGPVKVAAQKTKKCFLCSQDQPIFMEVLGKACCMHCLKTRYLNNELYWGTETNKLLWTDQIVYDVHTNLRNRLPQGERNDLPSEIKLPLESKICIGRKEEVADGYPSRGHIIGVNGICVGEEACSNPDHILCKGCAEKLLYCPICNAKVIYEVLPPCPPECQQTHVSSFDEPCPTCKQITKRTKHEKAEEAKVEEKKT